MAIRLSFLSSKSRIALAGLLFAAFFIGGILNIATSPSANAATAGWNAGRIINDDVFTKYTSMSASQIQTFLNKKVPTCDTNGQQLSEKGGSDLNGDGKVQRWEWAKKKYNQTKFVCLKNYKEDGKTAAQIIYNAAREFKINPQVLIVLLQKEQVLITDTWPLNVQYRTATGYGCPDSAPCDSDYFGLTNQIRWSGRMFRAIMNDSPSWYTPYVLGNNYIQYNPTSSCGGKTVNIQNRSTQALYNYTPYQPNKAALNAAMGQTVNCGAYGNINFYRYFSSWFGSPNGGDLVSSDVQLKSSMTINPANPTKGQTVTVTFTFKNDSNSNVTFDRSVMQCRGYKGEVCDSGLKGALTVLAGQEKTFNYAVTPTAGSSYTLIPFFSQNDVWYRFGDDSFSNSRKMTIPDVRMIAPMTMSPRNPVSGQKSNVTYTFKNYGSAPVTFEDTVLQCRYDSSINCDSAYKGATTLASGQTKTYTSTMTFSGGGEYRLIPYFKLGGGWYQYRSTTAAPNTLVRDIPDMRLVGNVTTNPSQPIPGEPMTATYTVKNFGTKPTQFQRAILQCRFNTSTSCDPAYQTPNMTINAGEQKTFTVNLPAAKAGKYTFKPYFEQNSEWHLYNKGTANNNSFTLNVAKYVADMRLVGNISVSPSKPIPGKKMTITYKVKNVGTKTAYYQRSLLQCRYNTTTFCDPKDHTPYLVIAPGEEKTLSASISSAKAGAYNFKPFFQQNKDWHSYGKGTAKQNTLLVKVPSMVITSAIKLNPSSPRAGKNLLVTFSFKNMSTKNVTFSKSVLQCRLNSHTNCDSPNKGSITFRPGESRTFSYKTRLPSAGSYKLIPYFMVNGVWRTYGAVDGRTNQYTFAI